MHSNVARYYLCLLYFAYFSWCLFLRSHGQNIFRPFESGYVQPSIKLLLLIYLFSCLFILSDGFIELSDGKTILIPNYVIPNHVPRCSNFFFDWWFIDDILWCLWWHLTFVMRVSVLIFFCFINSLQVLLVFSSIDCRPIHSYIHTLVEVKGIHGVIEQWTSITSAQKMLTLDVLWRRVSLLLLLTFSS